MHPRNILQGFALSVLSVILISCAPPPNDMSKFPGEYVYRSKPGQVESLTINVDGTLRNEIYAMKIYMSIMASRFLPLMDTGVSKMARSQPRSCIRFCATTLG